MRSSKAKPLNPRRAYTGNALALSTALALSGCHQAPALQAGNVTPQPPSKRTTQSDFVGFDRNIYPGDERLQELRQHFAFTGYWLTPPPGETSTTWLGKRQLLRDAGFGFLVLANGRLDAQIKNQIKSANLTPTALGTQDAAQAIAAAQQEGFPPATILFLDQEEGGRLLPEQSAYFFAWTEAVAASPFKPGAYLSGQPTPDGTGPDGKPILITTAQDVREHITQHHLHDIALWVYQDTCPPAPGCVATPPPLKTNGTPEAIVWQYAQSPRRPELTHSCAQTYASDNNCYAGASTDLLLDLNVAATSDPSHGR